MSWLITPEQKVPVDPLFGSVSLLLHGNGTNGSTTIIDSSPSPKTVTAVGNAQISTAQSKFGGASIAFDGTGDYLAAPGGSDFIFGTGDFTIEFWVNSSVLTTATIYPNFVDFRPLVTQGAYPTIFYNANASSLVYYVNTNAVISGGALLENTWYHIAVARASESTKMFVNGVQVGSTYNDSSNYTCGTNRPTIGAQGYNPDLDTRKLTGYIDEFRITKGVARYTTNFTPPTAPFPDA
jgi:hypothetical protein